MRTGITITIAMFTMSACSLFGSGGNIEAFPESEVVGIFLSAGVSLVTKGASVKIPRGTIVDASLRTHLTVRR